MPRSAHRLWDRRATVFRDFSRFSEERPLPHVVTFEAVICRRCHAAVRFWSARKGAYHQFSGPENWYRPGPWVDYGKSTIGFDVASRDLDDPLMVSALRTRILAIQKK